MTAKKPPRHIRIFLSSPGDVTNERNTVRETLKALNDDPLIRNEVTIEIIAWEAPESRVLLPVSLTPQQAIDQKLAKPSETDAVIVLFWGRIGTQLDVQRHGTKSDGTPYLSGTEWEYLDAVEGARKHPLGLPLVLLYRRTDDVPAPPQKDFATVKQYLEALEDYALQLKHVEAFFERFRDPRTGAYHGGFREYSSPDDFRAQFTQDARLLIRELISRQTDSRVTPAAVDSAATGKATITWAGSPFPGLRAFTENDEPIFFGRNFETADLIKRLSRQRLIFVVGASGSGKSSLVSAGVLPKLRRGALYGVGGLHIVSFTPGSAPFLRLSRALLQTLPSLYNPSSDAEAHAQRLAESLQKSPDSLARYVEEWLADDHQDTELLLFIDQFEELFATTAEPERAAFAAMLSADSARIRVIATMRSDFYDSALGYFEKVLRDSSYTLGVPSPGALREMITLPAEITGLDFEEGLAEEIVSRTAGQAGALALMAYTLDELYKIADQRHDHRLTFADYHALGGVQGAIGKRADHTFASLQLADKELLLRRVFRELVTVNERGVATRQRAPQEQFDQHEKALVDAFASASLLIKDKGEVEVAHEALFREWSTLADWIEATKDDHYLRRYVEREANLWHAKGCDPNYLWRQERLLEVYEMIFNLGIEHEIARNTVLLDFVRPEPYWLLHELEQPVAHRRRAEIGDRLDAAGRVLHENRSNLPDLHIFDLRSYLLDPRVYGLEPDGMPHIVWCEVPAGEVMFRLGREDVTRIIPQPFLMARYPVTFRQFEAFRHAQDGYANPHWWQGFASRQRAHVQAEIMTGNHPINAVSWYEAVAFCRWLTARYMERGLLPAGQTIRLPLEWEWQQAAVEGGPPRVYPWGDEWDSNRANTVDSGLGRTVAVGLYPTGQPRKLASPQGCDLEAGPPLDLAGNVAEWCWNERKRLDITIPDPDHEVGSQRVLRGSSWHCERPRVTTTYREDSAPPSRDLKEVGFRVVLAPNPGA